jgi:hypothetical protein
MITTYERGKIAERRESVLLQLETRFSTLSPAVKARVDGLSPEQLRQIQMDIFKAQSLKDLGLED